MYSNWRTNFDAGKQDYVFVVSLPGFKLKKYSGDDNRDIYLYPDKDLSLDEFYWICCKKENYMSTGSGYWFLDTLMRSLGIW